MRALALLLCLAACAPSEPARRELERGTFTPPPPAPTRPGVGLPTYDPHVKPLPPQPQPKPNRLLPPTREPGLWASDEPKDSKGKGGKGPVLWEVELPMPPLNQIEDPEKQIGPALACTRDVRGRVISLNLKDRITTLLMPQRTCLLTRIYTTCLRHMVDGLQAQKASGQDVTEALKHASRTARVASDFHTKWCLSSATPELDDIAVKVERTWSASPPSGGLKQ